MNLRPPITSFQLNMKLRNVLSAFWLVLCAGWLAAFAELAHQANGVQWIAHVGNACPAALNIFMALLCLSAAVALLWEGRLAKVLIVFIVIFAALHLFETVGIYLMSQQGPEALSPILQVPFYLLSSVVPTNTMFTEQLIGFWPLFILPLSSLLLSFVECRNTNQKPRNIP